MKNKEKLFLKNIGDKEKQKLKSLRKNKPSIWSGIGMFGMVGWSIAVPTLLGALLGLWLDKKHPQSYSYTLSLMIFGLFIGCLIAWFWVIKENKEINNNNDDDDT